MEDCSDSNSFGQREWIFLFSIFIMNFLNATEESIQAPLFPPEAMKKGVDATIYASIIGSTELIAFFSVPVTSVLLLRKRLDLRFCFLVLAFSKGIFIIYGLLDLTSYSFFILIGYLSHALEGIGLGGMITLSVFVCLVFPKRVAMMTGLAAPAGAIGTTLGPIFGEAIFDLGGYMAAMITTGVIYLLVALCLSIILPEVPKIPRLTATKIILEYFVRILSVSTVIYSVGMLVVVFGAAYMYALLKVHLEQFKLTNTQIGFMFACVGLPQILSPLWGHMADKTGHGGLISLIGGVFGMLGIAGVGPITILPLQKSVTLTAVGLVLFGLGQGALSSCNFANIDSDTSNIEISGGNTFTRVIFIAVFQVMSMTLGGSVGYSVAGAMADNYGYEDAFNLLCFTYAFMCLLLLYQTIVIAARRRSGSIKSPVYLVEDPSDSGRRLETSPLLKGTS